MPSKDGSEAVARITGNVEINIFMKNLMFQNPFQNQNVQSQPFITRELAPSQY
jgi:hypothetical protein